MITQIRLEHDVNIQFPDKDDGNQVRNRLVSDTVSGCFGDVCPHLGTRARQTGEAGQGKSRVLSGRFLKIEFGSRFGPHLCGCQQVEVSLQWLCRCVHLAGSLHSCAHKGSPARCTLHPLKHVVAPGTQPAHPTPLPSHPEAQPLQGSCPPSRPCTQWEPHLCLGLLHSLPHRRAPRHGGLEPSGQTSQQSCADRSCRAFPTCVRVSWWASCLLLSLLCFQGSLSGSEAGLQVLTLCPLPLLPALGLPQEQPFTNAFSSVSNDYVYTTICDKFFIFDLIFNYFDLENLDLSTPHCYYSLLSSTSPCNYFLASLFSI